ncbi:MAG: isoprenyl transferase [Sedimentisphaerales bacterium]|nr:isoprenyl transferase [Sedimentisphaerales bacterium]
MKPMFAEKREKTAHRLGIEPPQVPRHIAIIMDGNGRWAQQQNLPRFRGHEKGAKTVEEIAKYCVDIGLECLSLYSFSMQNWKRPKEEIDFLMFLYSSYLKGIQPTLMEKHVRLVHLGRREPLPQDVLDALDETLALTQKNPGMALGLALNYGSRSEIADAVCRIAQECKKGILEPEEIDENCISDHLYTAGLVDPDLLIRTSGELRISDFLLWQISYTEFYVTDTLWPDFSTDSIDEAILAYAGRSRRFGDVKAQPAS